MSLSLPGVCPILTSLTTVISTVSGFSSSKTPAASQGTFNSDVRNSEPALNVIWSAVVSIAIDVGRVCLEPQWCHEVLLRAILQESEAK